MWRREGTREADELNVARGRRGKGTCRCFDRRLLEATITASTRLFAAGDVRTVATYATLLLPAASLTRRYRGAVCRTKRRGVVPMLCLLPAPPAANPSKLQSFCTCAVRLVHTRRAPTSRPHVHRLCAFCRIECLNAVPMPFLCVKCDQPRSSESPRSRRFVQFSAFGRRGGRRTTICAVPACSAPLGWPAHHGHHELFFSLGCGAGGACGCASGLCCVS
ncbi:hypothetical protein BC567DRAFT_92369 [Phyllosticta citribraziliensis]